MGAETRNSHQCQERLSALSCSVLSLLVATGDPVSLALDMEQQQRVLLLWHLKGWVTKYGARSTTSLLLVIFGKSSVRCSHASLIGIC